MATEVLPPLPPMDEESLSRNAYDPLNRVKVADFWGDARITRTEIKELVPCSHVFKTTQTGVVCGKCRLGYLGQGLEVREGKLLLKGKQIQFLADKRAV